MHAMPELRSRPTRQGEFAGRIALVTGSTSGIGLGIARALAQAGATIVLNGLNPREDVEALEAVLVADYDVPVAYTAADLSDPVAIAAVVEETFRRFGRIDILVNNAGIQHVAPIDAFP